MKPLIIIIPYFGQWPFWFSVFLESCRYNAQVSWLFYTDCGVPDQIPDNTEFVEISFANYKECVSERLGIDFHPENPYKLCDLKPMLGYVHRDQIEGFDFWAFGDVDVIYGDLLAYYQPLMLRYDCVSTHITRVSGHLCILRNTEEMVTAFQKIKGWREVLADPDHQNFDEKHFTKLFVKHKNWPQWMRSISDHLNPLRAKSLFHEAYTTPNCRHLWHDSSRNFPASWCWEKGRLTNSRDGQREYPYLHFMYWKGDVWPHMKNQERLYRVVPNNVVVIDEDGFRCLEGE